jgi:dCMP deaminase
VSVAEATAYVSHYPCITCAKILAASGVKTIKYHFDYANDPLVEEVCAEAGVEIVRF